MESNKKMRIIGGKFKGKSILFHKSLNTRPLKDSVKENIFNIIMHSNLINVEINNSNILDLYSGVGSFGLEALSRGAKSVTFIEKNKITISILKRNIQNLAFQEKIKLFESDVHQVIEDERTGKFDFLFLDPPFADDTFIDVIKLLKKKKKFNKKNLVIIHREKRTVENFEKILPILFIKTYGRSKIFFGSFST